MSMADLLGDTHPQRTASSLSRLSDSLTRRRNRPASAGSNNNNAAAEDGGFCSDRSSPFLIPAGGSDKASSGYVMTALPVTVAAAPGGDGDGGEAGTAAAAEATAADASATPLVGPQSGAEGRPPLSRPRAAEAVAEDAVAGSSGSGSPVDGRSAKRRLRMVLESAAPEQERPVAVPLPAASRGQRHGSVHGGEHEAAEGPQPVTTAALPSQALPAAGRGAPHRDADDSDEERRKSVLRVVHGGEADPTATTPTLPPLQRSLEPVLAGATATTPELDVSDDGCRSVHVTRRETRHMSDDPEEHRGTSSKLYAASPAEESTHPTEEPMYPTEEPMYPTESSTQKVEVARRETRHMSNDPNDDDEGYRRRSAHPAEESTHPTEEPMYPTEEPMYPTESSTQKVEVARRETRHMSNDPNDDDEGYRRRSAHPAEESTHPTEEPMYPTEEPAEDCQATVVARRDTHHMHNESDDSTCRHPHSAHPEEEERPSSVSEGLKLAPLTVCYPRESRATQTPSMEPRGSRRARTAATASSAKERVDWGKTGSRGYASTLPAIYGTSPYLPKASGRPRSSARGQQRPNRPQTGPAGGGGAPYSNRSSSAASSRHRLELLSPRSRIRCDGAGADRAYNREDQQIVQQQQQQQLTEVYSNRNLNNNSNNTQNPSSSNSQHHRCCYYYGMSNDRRGQSQSSAYAAQLALQEQQNPQEPPRIDISREREKALHRSIGRLRLAPPDSADDHRYRYCNLSTGAMMMHRPNQERQNTYLRSYNEL